MNWFDLPFFEVEFEQTLQRVLDEQVEGKLVLPDLDDILNAYHTTPLDKVRVVILGQDPYPTPGHAHGLAFSVRPEVEIPASLRNIYAELQDDLGVTRVTGNLQDWAEQGVFLLNTSLTVLAGSPGSHQRYWTSLIRQTLEAVSSHQEHVAFILWGNPAQGKSVYINRRQNHLIHRSPHPSPLSARTGFFGSKPFSKTNIFLDSHGIRPIFW